MTKHDLELLYLRSENAQISLKELSLHLKKTPQRLKYALSVLEKGGILHNPYCIFDYSHFGLLLFRVYFRGGYISEHDKEHIIHELSENQYIVAISELTGEFDLAIEFATPNPSRFNKELKKITTLIPTLNDYKILLNFVTYLYPRNYLVRKQNVLNLNSEKIIGGDRDIEVFHTNEMKIIKHLLTQPTTRLTELAKNSGVNVKTAKSVLKNLMKRNIVRGFKYSLATTSLNVTSVRLFLKLHNLTIEKEAELMEYLLSTKEVVLVNKTVGDWDLEIDIESLDKSSIRLIIIQLREQFKEIIERFNLIECYTVHKRTYLPRYLFKEDEVKRTTV